MPFAAPARSRSPAADRNWRRPSDRATIQHMMNSARTTCLVVGGGPAGMVLGLLMARAGVEVTVLEKHADFLRDFRGDTVHASTLALLDELGLGERFAAHPAPPPRPRAGAARQRQLSPSRDLRRLPGAAPAHRAGAAVGPARPAGRRGRGASRRSPCAATPRSPGCCGRAAGSPGCGTSTGPTGPSTSCAPGSRWPATGAAPRCARRPG